LLSFLSAISKGWNNQSDYQSHTLSIRKELSSKVKQNRFKEPFFDVLAIVLYNYCPPPDQVVVHYQLWLPIFPNMVIFGLWDHKVLRELIKRGLPVSHNADDINGLVSQKTIVKALMRFHSSLFAGYVYIHDDLLVSPKDLAKLDKNNIWFSECITKYAVNDWKSRKHKWGWFNNKLHGINSMQRILDEDLDIYSGLERCGGIHTWYHGQSDFFYFPARMLNSFLSVMEVFASHELFFEIAVPTWVACFSNGFDQLQTLSLCTNWNFLLLGSQCSESVSIIHPVKYSQPSSLAFAKKFLERNAFNLSLNSFNFSSTDGKKNKKNGDGWWW
jgi:hypothetical protein